MENAGLSLENRVNTDDLDFHKGKKGETRTPYVSTGAMEWYYKKHEAEMNHRYAIDAANIQNQLMIEQWNRENKYNDPTVVAERYRAAGINPRSAFGEGSAHGAGIASHANVGAVSAGSASGSYGPSDRTQNIENANKIVGMINDVAGQGVAIAKSIGGLTNISADNTQKRVVTEGLQIENRFKEQTILTGLTKQRAEITDLLSSKDLKDSQRDFYVKRLGVLDQQIKESEQRITESGQRIEESKQSVKESQSRERLNDKTAEKVSTETSIMNDQRSAMLEGLLINNNLKDTEIEYYMELTNKVEKEIDLIANELEYYDLNLYARLAQMTSSELRGWANVLNDYIERRDQKDNQNKSNYEKKRQNRILLLRTVLPFLLKLKK